MHRQYKSIKKRLWNALQAAVISKCFKQHDWWLMTCLKNNTIQFEQPAIIRLSQKNITRPIVRQKYLAQMQQKWKIQLQYVATILKVFYLVFFIQIYIKSNLIIPTLSGPEKSVVIRSVVVTGVEETYVFKKAVFL